MNSMRLVHHSNACFSLFYKNLHFLFDPWLEAPAVGGGWAQFPPVKIKTEDLPKIDYIFISHIHSDHCEIETLKKIDKNIPVIIMEREPNFLKKYLAGVGFKNILAFPKEQPAKVTEDFSVELLGESFGHLCNNIIDSSIIFRFSDGRTVLNCNDNKPSKDLCEYIIKKYEKIDLAFIPCGGGSGYPAMYENISYADKVKISDSIVQQYAKVFTEAVDILKPSVVVPVAGGFAIRGHHAETVNWVQCRGFNLNDVSEYYFKNTKLAAVVSKIIPMQPEMELDVFERIIVKGSYHVWTDDELKTFLKKLSEEKIETAVKTKEPIKNLGRLISIARSQLWLKQQKNEMKPDYRVYINVPTHHSLVEIDLSSDRCVEIARDKALNGPYIKMTLDQDTLLDWLLGFEDFNMLDSGHRISFYREPITKYVQEASFLMSLLRMS